MHGAACDYKRWTALNANSWSNNRLNLRKPPVSYNQFGGVFSGPVYVPRLYNGRNRAFFSFSLESNADKADMSRRARVPSELERNGDFSQTLSRLGTGWVQIYDPRTTTGSGTTATRTVFPGARIPAAQLNPTGSVVAKTYPLPTQPRTPQHNKFNWAAAGITEVNESQFSIRGDHTFSPRQRVFGRYSRLTRRQEGQDLMPGAYSYPEEGSADLGLETRVFHSIALDHTATWSPTLVGSLRYDLHGRNAPRTVPPILQDPAPLGLHPDILRNQSVKGWPRFNLPSAENFANFGSTKRKERWYTHTAVATVYKSLGNHTLKFGGDYRVTRGLSVHWTYTNSKLTDNNTTSVVNERHYRAVSSFDQAQVMRLSCVYDLPFGPGKVLGSRLTGLPARLVEGWSLSGYFHARSGTPLSILYANGRPIRLRNAAKSGDVANRLGDRRDPVTKKVLNPYFNIDAFAPSPTQYWVTPEPPALDELRGPGGFGQNLSLTKAVRIWERLKLQFRGEANNFTNSPSWGSPGTNMSEASTFGVITSGGGGRNIQMSARLTF